MWEFLAQLLEKGGVVAVLLGLIVVGFGWAFRTVWNDNRALRVEVKALQEDYAERLNGLQERRVNEARQVTEQVVKHTANVDRAVDKLESALDTLIAALKKD